MALVLGLVRAGRAGRPGARPPTHRRSGSSSRRLDVGLTMPSWAEQRRGEAHRLHRGQVAERIQPQLRGDRIRIQWRALVRTVGSATSRPARGDRLAGDPNDESLVLRLPYRPAGQRRRPGNSYS